MINMWNVNLKILLSKWLRGDGGVRNAITNGVCVRIMINGGKRVYGVSLYMLSLVAMGTAQALALRSTRLVEESETEFIRYGMYL